MLIVNTIIVSLIVLYGVIEIRKGLGRVADEVAGLKQAIETRKSEA